MLALPLASFSSPRPGFRFPSPAGALQFEQSMSDDDVSPAVMLWVERRMAEENARDTEDEIALRERVTRLESQFSGQAKKIEAIFDIINQGRAAATPERHTESSLTRATAGLITAITTLVGVIGAWLSGIFDK